ncbi:MAG: alpha/beta hydrolase-fold protein [Planctomycetota bacterium]
MSKLKQALHSRHLGQDVTVTRWGEVGTPVLFFPTAAADAEEVERFLMVQSLAPLLAAGKIKLYSVDSVAGQALLAGKSASEIGRVQTQYDDFVYRELVPAIRKDCHDPKIEIVVTGPSIGAFNALSMICRHPDAFSKAICMSGTYDITKWMNREVPIDLYYASPVHFLPGLKEGEQLARLRQRFILLTHGTGRWEEPEQSWRVADVLGAKGIPNRVDAWEDRDHDWPTWREMLPQFLKELV